jgi:DNA adenine methylase
LKPFLKWAGGKKQLLSKILPLVPEKIGRYYEPFVGGGAVFFALKAAGKIFDQAYLADTNWRLIDTYQAVRDHLPELVRVLQEDFAGYSRESETGREALYYHWRETLNSMLPSDYKAGVGGLMILLNKTCFNGLYRENSSGEMNAPYGRRMASIDISALKAASKALQGVSIGSVDYKVALHGAGDGDFVYLDPPYAKLKKTSFTGYGKNKFGDDDQAALAAECRRLDHLGVKFVASNADVPLIRDLYQGFIIETVPARRAINRDGSGRGLVNEVLIRNYHDPI